MGTDIYIIREAFVDGKWVCCEKTHKEYMAESKYKFESKIRDEASADADFGRNGQLFDLLNGRAYYTLLDYPNGLPDGISEMTKMRIEDEDRLNSEFLKRNNIPDTSNNRNQYYNCTFKEMEDFMEKWRNDMIETGCLPYEFIDEDGLEKYNRLENGIYKYHRGSIKRNKTNRFMKTMLSIFDDPEFNVMKRFLDFLNNETSKIDLKSIKSENKRIIFWFSW